MLDIDTLATTAAAADTYHARHGNSAWTGEDADKTSAIWRGQSYIAGKYNQRWIVAFDADDAPAAVQYAIAEAALLELGAPSTLTPALERGGQVTSLNETVSGAVSVSTTWADGAPVETKLTVIENILYGAGLITSGSTTTGLVSRG